MTDSQLVLFVPFYNESKREGIVGYINALAALPELSLVLVNDGSTDTTNNILSSFQQPNIEIYSHAINLGKGNALRVAMLDFQLRNKANFMGYLDCDGAFPIDTVSLFIDSSRKKFLDNEILICIASRIKLAGRKVERKEHRHYISRVIITLLGIRYTFMPYDSQSGLKIFRVNEGFENSLRLPFKTKWLFDVELLDRLTKKSSSNVIWEEPVQEWRDKPGSHLKIRHVISVAKELLLLLLAKKSLND
mgnify:FL=1